VSKEAIHVRRKRAPSRTPTRPTNGSATAAHDGCETVAGETYPVAVTLHGTTRHYAYHAGRIALLKKLAG
jgi:hypothetical protein